MYSDFKRTGAELGFDFPPPHPPANKWMTNFNMHSAIRSTVEKPSESPTAGINAFPNFLKKSMVLEGYIANIHLSVTSNALEIGKNTGFLSNTTPTSSEVKTGAMTCWNLRHFMNKGFK